jgi:hypothetical protein
LSGPAEVHISDIKNKIPISIFPANEGFLKEGRTLEKLGLSKLGAKGIRHFAQTGERKELRT